MDYEGNKQALNTESVKSLQLILEDQQNHPVAYKDALEIGESLIAFYETLAEDKNQPEPIYGLKVEHREQGA